MREKNDEKQTRTPSPPMTESEFLKALSMLSLPERDMFLRIVHRSEEIEEIK
jgi:hypothetical protein